jgi:hypothetical protein
MEKKTKIDEEEGRKRFLGVLKCSFYSQVQDCPSWVFNRGQKLESLYLNNNCITKLSIDSA